MNIRSHLVFEIGTLNTRVGYFEEVGSRLRFINSAIESSTHMAPENNAKIGILKAIRALEGKLGKQLLREGALIIPEDANGEGADACAGLFSFGSAISTLVVDLARKDNTENILDIVARNNMWVADVVNDKDILNPAFMLNVLEESAIELIFVWVDKNTDLKKIENVIELARLAQDVFGPEFSPYLLMIGDQRKLRQISVKVRDLGTHIFVVPFSGDNGFFNEVDPGINLITERRVYRMIPTMADIKQWINKDISYSDLYTDLFIRSIAKTLPKGKNILHIDIGASSILLTGRVNGVFAREKFDQLGVGVQFIKALSVIKLPSLMKLGAFPSEDKVRNYIFTRSLQPGYIPDRSDELAIHYEVARAMLRHAFDTFHTKYFPSNTKNRNELAIDRIYLSGEIFTNAPEFHYLARLVLEGLKLHSAAAVYLDRYNISSMIGKITENASEVYNSMDLRSCVVPAFYVFPAQSNMEDGDPIVKCQLMDEDSEKILQFAKGEIGRIDLSENSGENVLFQPIGHTDVGAGKGIPIEALIPGEFKILLIDARERPLELPSKLEDRKNLITRWQVSLEESR